MAIMRGVSLYSYQQAYFKGELTLEQCMEKVHTSAQAPGLELIYEQMPAGRYPDPYDWEVSKFKELLAKYELTPTCMDSFIDSKLYRGRESTIQEQVQMMEQDLKLASRLGFYCIRVLAVVPLQVFEQAIPIAEYYGVSMGREVHAPLHLHDPWIQDTVELARKYNTKAVSLIPDFGIFMRGPSGSSLHYAKVMGADAEMIDLGAAACREGKSVDEVAEILRAAGAGEREIQLFDNPMTRRHRYCDPELLREVKNEIVHFHGKCNRFNEDCEEMTIDFANPIRVMKEMDWSGCIATEFEGQRAYHGIECPYEEDEVEQVRRHHVLLRKLLGE
ncbi:MAG: hypothetical protein E7449_01270 [Ruminococcaceae bacterium]|nr:hypothetical protein [Oscillospiraceae bacterium]